MNTWRIGAAILLSLIIIGTLGSGLVVLLVIFGVMAWACCMRNLLLTAVKELGMLAGSVFCAGDGGGGTSRRDRRALEMIG